MLRRAGRTLSKIGCGVSLLLCALTCVLWVRSYVVSDVLNYTRPTWGLDVRSGLGKLHASLGLGSWSSPGLIWLHDTYSPGRRASWAMGPRFDLDKYPDPITGNVYYAVGAPHALLVVGFSIAPIVFCAKSYRARKRTRGVLCPKCGYDLRASPLRCPECGTMREALKVRG